MDGKGYDILIKEMGRENVCYMSCDRRTQNLKVGGEDEKSKSGFVMHKVEDDNGLVYDGLENDDTWMKSSGRVNSPFNNHEVNGSRIEEMQGSITMTKNKEGGESNGKHKVSGDEESKTRVIGDDRLSDDVMHEVLLDRKGSPKKGPTMNNGGAEHMQVVNDRPSLFQEDLGPTFPLGFEPISNET